MRLHIAYMLLCISFISNAQETTVSQKRADQLLVKFEKLKINFNPDKHDVDPDAIQAKIDALEEEQKIFFNAGKLSVASTASLFMLASYSHIWGGHQYERTLILSLSGLGSMSVTGSSIHIDKKIEAKIDGLVKKVDQAVYSKLKAKYPENNHGKKAQEIYAQYKANKLSHMDILWILFDDDYTRIAAAQKAINLQSSLKFYELLESKITKAYGDGVAKAIIKMLLELEITEEDLIAHYKPLLPELQTIFEQTRIETTQVKKPQDIPVVVDTKQTH